MYFPVVLGRLNAWLRRGLLVLACAVPLAGARAQTPPAQWQNWLTSLQGQGYAVAQGNSYLYTTTYCQAIVLPVFNSCFGVNDAKPYVVLQPPAGGGYIDPYFGAFGSATTAQGVTVSQAWRIAPADAVVTVVILPPNASYFSYQNYMLTRLASLYPGGVQKITADPTRGLIAATYNNSINNVAIQRQSGLTFGQGSVAFISTGNATLAAALTSSFQAGGSNPNLLFVDPMGANLNLGLTQSNDDFQTVFRYSVPQDQTASTAWLNNLGANIFVYRITAPASVGYAAYPTDVVSNKSPATDETPHASTLAELSSLLQGWLAGQQGSAVITKTIATITVNKKGSPVGGLFGPYCISTGILCDFDQQDTDAYKIATIKLTKTGQMLIAGVNHVVTNNATYTSVEANDARLNAGIGQLSQSNPAATGFNVGSFTGSAAQALMDLGLYSQASPALIADLPNLYVQIFARSCPNTTLYCTRPYTQLIPIVQVGDPQKLLERAYVEPGYLNGGNPNFLLNPNVIH